VNQDQEHLKLLSIFHYVAAGMAALVACIPFLHFFMGLALVTGVIDDGNTEARPVGFVIMLIALGIIFCGWVFAALVAFTGRSLAQRKRYNFCLIMAAVECIFMPVGTVLGVFTIIVLVRDSVKELFTNV
jgi:hypothetical protein